MNVSGGDNLLEPTGPISLSSPGLKPPISQTLSHLSQHRQDIDNLKMTSRPTSIGSTIGSNSITFWAIQSTPNAYANLDGRNPSHARSVRTAHSVRTARSFSRSRGAAGLTALPSIHSVAFQHPPMPEIPNQFQKHQSTGKASEYEPGKETSGSARTGSSDLAELLDERPHFPAWRWVLSLIGLYLGAMLYGESSLVCLEEIFQLTPISRT